MDKESFLTENIHTHMHILSRVFYNNIFKKVILNPSPFLSHESSGDEHKPTPWCKGTDEGHAPAGTHASALKVSFPSRAIQSLRAAATWGNGGHKRLHTSASQARAEPETT